jgi:hypothetical protein
MYHPVAVEDLLIYKRIKTHTKMQDHLLAKSPMREVRFRIYDLLASTLKVLHSELATWFTLAVQ